MSGEPRRARDFLRAERAWAGLGAEGLVPVSLFRYVERTGETPVVDDALTDVRFAGDPYFRGLTRCSVLVVPILSRGGPWAGSGGR